MTLLTFFGIAGAVALGYVVGRFAYEFLDTIFTA